MCVHLWSSKAIMQKHSMTGAFGKLGPCCILLSIITLQNSAHTHTHSRLAAVVGVVPAAAPTSGVWILVHAPPVADFDDVPAVIVEFVDIVRMPHLVL